MKNVRWLPLAACCSALALTLTNLAGHPDSKPSPVRMPVQAMHDLHDHGDLIGILRDEYSYRPYDGAPRADAANAAVFQVTYTGFTPAAQAAFQHAVNIWANIITSGVPIRVSAVFSALPTGVLGSAGPGSVIRDFPNAPLPGTWFAEAIADRLAGSDLFPGFADIEADFTSTPPAPWYFGLDAQPPAGSFDFVTVVLHELGHGLGFFGSAVVSGGIGTIGIASSSTGQRYPVIYDRYVRVSGTPIVTVPNSSTTMAQALTSGNLFFQSPLTAPAGGDISAPAKLFSPATFQQGSSYSHLDENTFPAGNINSLMTPQIGTAEANHNPGPITGEIFTDIGWGAVGGGAAPGQPTVTSAVAAGGNLTVTWTSGGGGAPTSHRLDFYSGASLVAQVPTGAGTSAVIPLPPGVVGSFGVRVTAINAAGSSQPSALFNFTIGGGAPGQPTVTSANESGGVLTVQWTSGGGAAPTSHRLDFYQGATLAAQITTGAATSLAIPLPPGIQGSFSVTVTAFNGAISGPPSAPFAFNLGPTCTTPAQPTVTGSIVGGTATVSWNAVPGATHYIVSAGASQGGTNFLPPTNFTGTGVQASGLPAGFTAWIRVIAVNACGQQGPARDFFLQ